MRATVLRQSGRTLSRADRASLRARAARPQRPFVHRRGFAMLEVLITLVILLIGLLGLAGVVARSNAAELESYQRVQALILAQDMVDRINANRKYAACYSNGSTGVTLGTGYTGTPACAATAALTLAAERSQAVADLVAWD